MTVHVGGLERSAERRAGQSYLSSNSPWLHFGLGDATGEATVAVRWPGEDEPREYGPFALDARVVIER